MNIVYYSKLNGAKCAGMTYSVPSQIEAQSKYDNVYWVNLSQHKLKTPQDTIECNCLLDKKDYSIKNLPEPFNKPDLVVFQGVYHFEFYQIAKQLKKSNISYIIIPRSSLTEGGQAFKPLKKKIGNFILFNSFTKGAIAIHYLSKQEKIDSGDGWNRNSFIIPNGISAVESTKKYSDMKQIRGAFIGRIKIFQKGLDIFVEACASVKDELRQNKIQIDMYGPDLSGSVSELTKMIKNVGIEDLIKIMGPIYEKEKINTIMKYDFFVLPSRFEGHPMGLIEALAYGLPSLVTKGSNMAEEISEMNAGWTSDTSVSGIAQSFRKLIKEKNEFEAKSRNAFDLAKRYNWDEIANNSHKLYSKLLKMG